MQLLASSKFAGTRSRPQIFKVEECLTGKQATKLAMSLKPGLVLLDLNLPDMQGNEVITSLRAWSQAPIIILSARHHRRYRNGAPGKHYCESQRGSSS